MRICITTTDFFLPSLILIVCSKLLFVPASRSLCRLFICPSIYILCFFMSWLCKTNNLFSIEMLRKGLRGVGRRKGKWLLIFICTLKETLIIPHVSIYLFKVSVNHQSSYNERLKLCKVLKGFQVRSVTINRAVQYMNAGEDTQWTI